MKGSESVSKINILVVDDNEVIRRLMKIGLKGLGLDVTVSSCMEDALLKARAPDGKINVIVSDVVMPDGTGIELLKTIRNEKIDVLFFLFSGFEDITEELALASGADGFFRKPFEMSYLAAQVEARFATKQAKS